MDNLYISTSVHARERAGKLGEPSEDARHILGELPFPPQEPTNEYLPDEKASWVLTAELPGPMASAKLNEMFSGACKYGRDAGRWTFLVSSDAPKTVTALKLEYSYADGPYTASELKKLSLAAAEAYKVEFTPSLGFVEGAAHSAEVAHLIEECEDRCATITLVAPPEGFPGPAYWDALNSLGLEWGDMDCFHWNNPTDLGGDQLFSVQTNTEPGYFLPEQLTTVEDLVFNFDVARTPFPDLVYAAMLRAAQYCQKRLGGTVQEEDPEVVARIVAALAEAGLTPGESAVLQLL